MSGLHRLRESAGFLRTHAYLTVCRRTTYSIRGSANGQQSVVVMEATASSRKRSQTANSPKPGGIGKQPFSLQSGPPMKTRLDSTPEVLKTASLDERIARKRAGRLHTIPTSCRKLFERSWAGKTSPRASVKAFCLECLGFDRIEIKHCTAFACPLWPIRPYQKLREGAKDQPEAA